MAWDVVSKSANTGLNASDINQLQSNFSALTDQASGAPVPGGWAVNSGFHSPNVSSFGTVHVSSGINAPEVSSFGTVNVSSGFTHQQAGYILQVKQLVDTTNRSTTSTSFVTTSISLALDNNLRNTDSKVLISVNGVIGASQQMISTLTLNDGSVDLHPGAVGGLHAGSNADNNSLDAFAFEFLDDTIASTTPKEYILRWKVQVGSGFLGTRGSGSIDLPTIMTLKEITG